MDITLVKQLAQTIEGKEIFILELKGKRGKCTINVSNDDAEKLLLNTLITESVIVCITPEIFVRRISIN